MVSILISTLGQQAKPRAIRRGFLLQTGQVPTSPHSTFCPLLVVAPCPSVLRISPVGEPWSKNSTIRHPTTWPRKTLHRHCGRIIQVENLGYDHAIRYDDGSLGKPLPRLADMLASQTSGSKRWPLMSEPSPSPTTWPLMAIMPRASARSTWRRSVTRGPI